jgi:two-component system CheB/CheR fusion protein
MRANKKNGVYRVKTGLREMIVYAVQNLVSDPPFSKLDLVSCRNVLIYMDGALQKKIVPLFHFTLNPDGFLFLGSSEAIGSFSSLFSSLDSKWKIFRVKKDRAQTTATEQVLAKGPDADDFGMMKEQIVRESVEEAVDRLIVRDYAPATILIDEKCEASIFEGPWGDISISPPVRPLSIFSR